MILRNFSPSLSGTFLRCVHLDELQELYVLLVKRYKMTPGSKELLNELNTTAANLDRLFWLVTAASTAS